MTDKANSVLIISSDQQLRKILNICLAGWGYKVFLWDTIASDITPIKKISPDVIIIDIHAAHQANLEICRTLKNDFLTAFIPVITLINKRQLRTQLLNLKHGIDDYLIKPPDPLDLRVRIEMAVRRSQHSFYASPLTGLPGSRICEEVLNEILEKNVPFSLGYLDLDNFKCFNDNYGYLKGDRVLMQTAYMLYVTVKKYGNHPDFIGHIGGDDFVFITTPDKYKLICHNFISAFEKIIPFHYSPQDRKNSFIISKNRSNEIRSMPLMSVSIAVVNRIDRQDFDNIFQINEKAAEIKSYLKGIPGSKFMAERRNIKKRDHLNPQVYKRQDYKFDGYKPLGQRLVEKKIISPRQLDEALNAHWRRGVIFGEILKELGLIKEEQLSGLLTEEVLR